MVKLSKLCYKSFQLDTDRDVQISLFTVQTSWNLADGKSVKSCVVHLTEKQKFAWLVSCRLLRELRPKSARASPRQCTQSAPDFLQIGSLLAEL